MEEVTGLPRSSKPHGGCHDTMEALRKDGMKVMDDCPVCLDNMVLCRVGAHPSATSTGKSTDWYLIHHDSFIWRRFCVPMKFYFAFWLNSSCNQLEEIPVVKWGCVLISLKILNKSISYRLLIQNVCCHSDDGCCSGILECKTISIGVPITGSNSFKH